MAGECLSLICLKIPNCVSVAPRTAMATTAVVIHDDSYYVVGVSVRFLLWNDVKMKIAPDATVASPRHGQLTAWQMTWLSLSKVVSGVKRDRIARCLVTFMPK